MVATRPDALPAERSPADAGVVDCVVLQPADGGSAAELRWTADGVWLSEGARDDGQEGPRRTKLSPDTHVALQRQLLLPRLHVAARAFVVPRHRLGAALELVALARLSALPGELREVSGPLVAPLHRVQRAALEHWLAPDEHVLGLLPTRLSHDGRSKVLGSYRAPRWVLLTDRRLRLVSVSSAGDREEREVRPEEVPLSEKAARASGSREHQLELVLALGRVPPERRRLRLAHAAREWAVARARNELERVHAELGFIAALEDFGELDAAREQLTRLHAELPPLTLADVDLPTNLPPSDFRAAHVEFRDLALRAHAEQPLPQLLARLELTPLDRSLLEQVGAHAPPALAERVRRVLQLLFEPSEPRPEVAEVAVLRALEPEERAQLRHPLATEHERWFSRLQALAAKTERPDYATLKSFCQRVTDSDSEVARVVDEAATLLGVGHVQVHVSRGEDDVGARAFADRQTLLLVGGQHLTPGSRHHLTGPELLFAVTTELAHLSFGHERVAPRDVARGVLDKSRLGADVALSLLPVVARLGMFDRLGVITAKLSLPRVGRSFTTVRQLLNAVDSAVPNLDPNAMTRANEALLRWHRFTQLTADRAGLVACGDLAVALRAMLRMRADYTRLDTRLVHTDLMTAMREQRVSHPAAFDDLSMRIGFLVHFALQDEFVTLASGVRSAPVSRRLTTPS